MTLKECYRLLQVAENANLEEVKSAYRKRAFELHPDLNPGRPEAARRFQMVNEAYVLLTQHVSGSGAKRATGKTGTGGTGAAGTASGASKAPPRGGASQRAAREETVSGAQNNYERAKGRFEWAAGGARQQAKAAGSYQSQQAQQDEVLRDILNDPFARRVFEDIYREIRKSGGTSAKAPQAPPAAAQGGKKKLSLEVGKKKVSVDLTGGVTGALRGWARRQIDAEEVMYLPAESLVPGSKVRLQIQRGFSADKRTVEFTLPADFVVGRPVRLKGLGRRIGPWQGDLYIKLYAKI